MTGNPAFRAGRSHCQDRFPSGTRDFTPRNDRNPKIPRVSEWMLRLSIMPMPFQMSDTPLLPVIRENPAPVILGKKIPLNLLGVLIHD